MDLYTYVFSQIVNILFTGKITEIKMQFLHRVSYTHKYLITLHTT